MIRSFVCLATFAAAIWAQAPVLNGKFVIAEEGSASSSLGILTLDASGTISGTEYVQASGVTQSIPVTGSYTIAADGSGTITLAPSGSDASAACTSSEKPSVRT